MTRDLNFTQSELQTLRKLATEGNLSEESWPDLKAIFKKAGVGVGGVDEVAKLLLELHDYWERENDF